MRSFREKIKIIDKYFGSNVNNCQTNATNVTNTSKVTDTNDNHCKYNYKAYKIERNEYNNLDEWIWDCKLPLSHLAVDYLVKAPLFGQLIVKWTHAIDSASNFNMKNNYFKKNRSFAITPGGFHEASAFEYSKEVIYLSNKKGFIKYCLQYGYKVIPAYCFGESQTYFTKMNHKWLKKIKKYLNDRNLPFVLPFGPLWYIGLPILPNYKS